MPKVGERFNPHRMFTGNFIPEGISMYRSLPSGSKVVYARLLRYAGDHGEAYPSIATLAEQVGMSERQAWRYIRYLIEQHFLEVEKRTGQPGVYGFLWHSCFDGDTGGGRLRMASSDGEPVPFTAPVDTSAVYGTPTSAVPDTEPVPFTADKENQGRESIELNHFSPVVPVEEIIDELSRKRAAAKRGHRLNPEDRGALSTWLRDHCPEDPVSAFVEFLSDPYWRERKYPIKGFIGQFEKYRLASQGSNGGAKTDLPPPVDLPPVVLEPLNQPPYPDRLATAWPPGKDLPEPCREWNRVVTAGPPVENWTKRERPLETVMQDPEFLEALPKILERCQAIHLAQGDEASWLSFWWLLKKDKTNGTENWYKILREGAGWAKKKGRRQSAGAAAVDSLLAKLNAKKAQPTA